MQGRRVPEPVRRSEVRGAPLEGRRDGASWCRRAAAWADGSRATHVDRDRLARALAVASWRVVPVLARAARSFVESGGWAPYGYSRLRDFARIQLYRNARWCRDLARLGAGLERFPALERAFLGADGDRPIGRVAALCVARTASDATVADWIRVARALTLRALMEVAREVRRRGGDAPPAHILDEPPEASRASAENFHEEKRGAPARPGAGSSAENLHEEERGAPAGRGPGDTAGSSSSSSSFTPTERIEEEDDSDAQGEVCFTLPEQVDVAFDEVLRLHRAVCGGEATVASFVEALVGEACAGPHPVDTELVKVHHGQGRQACERALEKGNARWQRLQDSDAQPLSSEESAHVATLEREIVRVLSRMAELETEAGEGDLETLVHSFIELVRMEHVIDRLLGKLLRAMGRHGDWSQLGFSGTGHYAEERLGMSRRGAESRAGIEGALRSLPEVRRAYESDRLGLEAAWALARLFHRGPVDPVVESRWVEMAVQCGVKKVHDAARRTRLLRFLTPEQLLPPEIDDGSSAAIPAPGEGVPREAIFEGKNTTAATHAANAADTVEAVEAAIAADAADAMEAVEAANAAGAADVLYFREPNLETDPLDLSRIPTSAYEFCALTRTRPVRRFHPLPPTDEEWLQSLRRWPGMTWERVWRLGRSALIDPGMAARRWCRLPEDLACAFLSAIESTRRGLQARAEREGNEPDPGSPPSILASFEYVANRCRNVPSWVAVLAMLEDYAATWDDPRGIPRRRWERTYEDADYRCMAPGCPARAKIHNHHVDYRSNGGGHELWNRIAVCAFHHLHGEHGLFAEIRGTAPLDITWRLGLPKYASLWKNERRLDAPEAAAMLAEAARAQDREMRQDQTRPP
jgi:hypothetical protein